MPQTLPERPEPGHRSLANRLRHLLGLRQSFRIAGVRYRELSHESLRHALSRSGPGFKDYEAAFPDGATMKLRGTRHRVYADLAGPRLLDVYRRCDPRLKPGMRVLIPHGGTGYIGAWAAGRVAPSGAVVSLESDEESVAYARRRYRLLNASFEPGGLETLAGEVDGAFDAILAVEAIAPLDDEKARFAELWRLVRPGGWLLAAARRSADQTTIAASPSGGCTVEILSDEPDGWGVVLIHRPEV